MGDPFRNRLKAGGEIDAGGCENLGIERNKVEIRSLSCRVGTAGAGCEPVPQIKRRASREASMCLIPVIWDFVDEEVLGSCPASWKSLEYWKREAASAIALSTVEIHEDEKEKFK